MGGGRNHRAGPYDRGGGWNQNNWNQNRDSNNDWNNNWNKSSNNWKNQDNNDWSQQTNNQGGHGSGKGSARDTNWNNQGYGSAASNDYDQKSQRASPYAETTNWSRGQKKGQKNSGKGSSSNSDLYRKSDRKGDLSQYQQGDWVELSTGVGFTLKGYIGKGRIEEGKKHYDQKDLKAAADFVSRMIEAGEKAIRGS